MNKLPKVYANPINKIIQNVQNVYEDNFNYKKKVNPQNINKKINDIFASSSHIYKSKVRITYNDHKEDVVVVGKTNLNLLTMDGKLIRIIDIVDIEKI